MNVTLSPSLSSPLSSSLSSSSSLSFGFGLAFGFAIKPDDHRDFRTLFFRIGLFLAVEVEACEFRLAKSVLIGTILFVLGSKARFSSGLLSFFVSFFLLSMISYKDNTMYKLYFELNRFKQTLFVFYKQICIFKMIQHFFFLFDVRSSCPYFV